MNKQFFIFTDGSAIGNPGPAGWAAIVIHGVLPVSLRDSA
jgi:ribonuclease HI